MTRLLTIAVILVNLAVFSLADTQVPSSLPFINTLMPQPSQLSAQDGRLAITPSFKTITDHFKDARLDAAITRSLSRIKIRSGIAIPTSPDADTTSANLIISVEAAGETIQSVDENESYSLRSHPYERTSPSCDGRWRHARPRHPRTTPPVRRDRAFFPGRIHP